MGRIVYVPVNDKVWFDYYFNQAKQTGHGLGGFEGMAYQRGHGLGSFFGRLFRSILPIAKKAGKTVLGKVGKQAMTFGTNVIGDVIEGHNVKQSLKKHGATAGKNLLKKAEKAVFNQSGGRVGKRTVGSKVSPVPVKKRRIQKKKKSDIFP